MKLEVGKYYRTRNGDKVFLRETKEEGCVGFGQPHGLYLPDGKFGYMEKGRHRCALPDLDIIAEWTDAPEVGPVRTVTTTRREIVDGQYGHLNVTRCPASPLGVVGIDLMYHGWWSEKELTGLIDTLTTIRNAMQANTTA